MRIIINHLRRGFVHTLLLSIMIMFSGTIHAKAKNVKKQSHTVTHIHKSKPVKQKHMKVKPVYKEVHRKGITGHYRATGLASWYGAESGSRTATGAHFSPHGLTAAHRTLQLPTKVRVTNLKNHKSVIVTINDRGPFVKGRLIDLSQGAAKAVGLSGLGMVSIETVDRNI